MANDVISRSDASWTPRESMCFGRQSISGGVIIHDELSWFLDGSMPEKVVNGEI
jgi:hypothetical protein